MLPQFDGSCIVVVEMYYDGFSRKSQHASSRIEHVQFNSPCEADIAVVDLQAHIEARFPDLTDVFDIYRPDFAPAAAGTPAGKRLIGEMARHYENEK